MYIFILLFIVFNFIVFLHELARYATSIKFGVKINEFCFGIGTRIFKIKKNNSIYSLCAIPIGFFCSLEERESKENSFNKKSNLKKSIILLSSLFVDLILSFIFSIFTTSLQNNIYNTKINGFFQNSTSDSRGKLKIGDEIISINNYKTHIDIDILFAITSSNDNNFTFDIVRNGEFMRIENVSFPTDKFNENQVAKLDFILCKEDKNFINTMIYSSTKVGSVIRMFFKKLTLLITKHLSFRNFSEHINLVTQIDDNENAQSNSFTLSIINLIYLSMVISISLFLINLIPIYPFTSYMLLLILFEKVTHKKVSTRTKALLNTIIFIFSLSLSLLVIINDILKILKGI